MKKENVTLSYTDSVHKAGRIWGLLLFGLIFSFPIILCIIYQVVPKWQPLLQGIISILPMYWAVGIIEMFTYIPMLGAGGAYLSFVTGNIANLKLPCALDAMEKAEVKPGTEKGEVISTIAIATSSIVTTLIIIVGVCLIVPLSPILESESLTASFAQILPALFGGLSIAFVSKNVKLAMPSIIIMLILFIFVPALNASTVGIMVPVGVLFTLGIGRIMYKKGWIK